MKTVRVAVTGAAGQIAYSLLFRIAAGELFGKDTAIEFQLLELQEAVSFVKGVKMELEDGAFPLLRNIEIGSDPEEIFQDIDYAFLVGAKPRGPGMERKDLLEANARIFVDQGRALDVAAKKEVRVLVVGNPCNTNCLIALLNAPSIPPFRFFAMTMLDELRAKSCLAKKTGVQNDAVSNMAIWGNHSSTQIPAFMHAKISGDSALKRISDRTWLEGAFLNAVRGRGAEVIAARGKSSAASAANAAIEQMRAIITPTRKGDFFSAGVYAAGNPYGIDENLVFSFPIVSDGKKWEFVKGLETDPFLLDCLRISEKELQEERDIALSLTRSR